MFSPCMCRGDFKLGLGSCVASSERYDHSVTLLTVRSLCIMSICILRMEPGSDCTSGHCFLSFVFISRISVHYPPHGDLKDDRIGQVFTIKG